MSEDKTVEQTTEKTATDETVNEETSTPETTEETSTETKAEEVDYKAELEIAQNTIKTQKGIINHKEEVIKTEKAKNSDEIDDIAELEDETDRFAEFEKKQSQEMEDFKFNQTQDKIEDEINRLAKSEDEAELVRFHMRNSVKMVDYSLKSIQSAAKSAWLIANEKKILSTNTELANSLKAKSSMTTTANTSSQSIKEDPEEYSGEEKKLIDKFAKRGEKITASAPR